MEQEKERAKIQEKLERYTKESLLQFLDLLDDHVSRTLKKVSSPFFERRVACFRGFSLSIWWLGYIHNEILTYELCPIIGSRCIFRKFQTRKFGNFMWTQFGHVSWHLLWQLLVVLCTHYFCKSVSSCLILVTNILNAGGSCHKIAGVSWETS